MRGSRASGPALLAALTLCAFIWVAYVPSSNQNAVFSTSPRRRQLQEITFGTNTSMPSKLDDLNGWIHYGIYIGIVGAVFFVIGIIISITLCVGYCCRGFCLNFSKSGSKSCWFILYSVFFAVMTLLALLILIFSVVLADGFKQTKDASTELMTDGVSGAFNNIRSTVIPLNDDIQDMVNDTLRNIANSSFAPVTDLIDFAHAQIDQTSQLLLRADEVLNQTADSFDQLRSTFTVLNELQEEGFISGIPSNDSVPNVRAATGNVLTEASSSLNELNTQILNLSSTVEDVKSQIDENSPTVRNLFNIINTTFSSITSGIDSVETSYNNMNLTSQVENYYTKYVVLSNKIRLPVMIFLAVIPIILFGLWFVGIRTKVHKLMLVGYWWAAAICWLMMLLALIHLLLFVPLNDLCNNRDDLIRRGATQFIFTNGTNYASLLGISEPVEAVNTINVAVATFLDKPDVVLDCKGDDTLILALNVDIPTVLNLRGRFDEVRTSIQDQANSVNISDNVLSAQPSLENMDRQISDFFGNLTTFNETIANYMNTYNNFIGQFDPASYWNNTAQQEAENRLSDVNDLTSTYPVTPHTYTFQDIDTLDSSDYPLLTDPERAELEVNREAILGLMRVNQTFQIVNQQVQLWHEITLELSLHIKNATEIASEVVGLVQSTWQRLNDSLSLPQEILDAILAELDPAVDRAVQMARLEDLGKCKFIGDFMRKGFTRGVCRQVGGSAGGVAICIILLSFVWLSAWPIILSSKRFWSSRQSLSHDDFWAVEMTQKKA